MNDLNKILEIMQHEMDMEVQVAVKSDELLKKTINPIKRFRLSRQKQRFMDHAFGINLVIHKLKREFNI